MYELRYFVKYFVYFDQNMAISPDNAPSTFLKLHLAASEHAVWFSLLTQGSACEYYKNQMWSQYSSHLDQ